LKEAIPVGAGIADVRVHPLKKNCEELITTNTKCMNPFEGTGTMRINPNNSNVCNFTLKFHVGPAATLKNSYWLCG